MDVRPPQKHVVVPPRHAASEDQKQTQELPKPQIAPSPLNPQTPPPASSARKKLLIQRKPAQLITLVAAISAGFIAIIVGLILWYLLALTPRSADGRQIRFTVEPGETAASIAQNLHDHELIRSQLAFSIYTQLSGKRNQLQAGGYVLSANQDVASIVDHIVEGKTDEYNITIPPGLTLKELKKVFIGYGFSDDEVNTAFSASYSHPLLASRPVGATLEGYIFPETYRMGADQSLEALLKRSFDEMYKLLTSKKYLEEYTKRGFSIHQAVTLASIVQKEVASPTDQKQVAQVFLKRLDKGMQLGSDVTFMYAAKQMGVRESVGLDSPYNTRKYNGLPPGPIANMNPSALEAVAFPAQGDYLYFVAGDDGTTYFALTQEQHDANVAAHCHTLCQ